MIGADNNDIIIHVPMSKVKMRIAGVEREVLIPARGFAWVEHSDGATSVITNPFFEWIMSNIHNGLVKDFQFGFVFEGDTGRRDPVDVSAAMDLGVG